MILIGPDISMIGYLAGNKASAIRYNLFHHMAVFEEFIMAGYILRVKELLLGDIVIFGHSSFDRVLGYGL